MFGQTKSTSPSPPAQSTRPTASSTSMTPRHADLESSFPAAFFGKRKSATMAAPVEEAEPERRMSVSSTATTATTFSVSSEATTIAATPAQSISEKQMAVETTEEKQGRKEKQQQSFDVFEYQAAGYLSMPMDHEGQPYKSTSTSTSASASKPKSPSSSRKSSSSSSSSSSQSLWTKTKNLAQRRGSEQQRRGSAESEEAKQQKKKEYEELDLDKKTKFGMGEGAGMRIVG